jgi:uncharacterized protein YjbI with pentapeptide repeats
MDRDEALRLLTGGKAGIEEWNRWRKSDEPLPVLGGAHLERAHLRGAYLEGASLVGAHLKGAHLERAHLKGAHLEGADLREAHLEGAHLERAYLVGANLVGANLVGANLVGASLVEANLRGAYLEGANLRWAYLLGANLREAHLEGAHLERAYLERAYLDSAHLERAHLEGANLERAHLERAHLEGANLRGASCYSTIFADVDLSAVGGLDSIEHNGLSTIGTDTLIRSNGQIPEAFLRGCGLTPWEVLAASLYRPELNSAGLVELQNQIFDAWTKGRSMINGCFICYSWKDAGFVDKLRGHLVAEGVNVWLDRHDMVAGTIQDQVWRAIQVHHVVILVLSADSVKSDWVENELDMARNKEKAEGRAVLCPVALDEAWQAKVDAKGNPGDPSRQLWRALTQKLIVDFSGWKTKAFEGSFQKLLRGLKTNYGSP